MLTQGPAPDLKCKLNISSFLTLPHLSDCLISTRNYMSNVLLLQMMGGGVDLEQGVGYCLVVVVFLPVLLSFLLSCRLFLCLK